jgi:muconate cycloisomerase
VSLKLVKHAGLLGVKRVAAVAEAAHLHAFATLRELAWGCEHFGPQILAGGYVEEPLRFRDFHVYLPAGPGIGAVLDEGRLRHYARK